MSGSPGRSTFTEPEVKNLLRRLELPVPAGITITKGGTLPQSIGLKYPLVAKVISRKIISKTEAGGVTIGITSGDELKRTIARLEAIEQAEGVFVEEMAPEGVEVIVGGIIDPHFGPVVMFGSGGISAELYRDVIFGLAPISYEDALKLIDRVRVAPILKGYRGRPPVSSTSLVEIIISVSELIATGLFRELDLNPVALYHDRALILDAKLSLPE